MAGKGENEATAERRRAKLLKGEIVEEGRKERGRGEGWMRER